MPSVQPDKARHSAPLFPVGMQAGNAFLSDPLVFSGVIRAILHPVRNVGKRS